MYICRRLLWAVVWTVVPQAAAAWLATTPALAGITYDMVNVGNPGNANDTTGYGAVNDLYSIGKYDVTIGQYTAFLNAVAATDTYALYNASMATDLNVAGISRSGSSGSFRYSVITDGGSSANRPITYVHWLNAARFANWMSNGQPTGAQSSTTTENGAYDLTHGSYAKNSTNPNTGAAPTFFVPTENEWYKAAYYSPIKGGVGSPGYWIFATQSNSAPGNQVGGTANQANYFTGSGYSVTQSPTFSASQNYLTDVGAFSGSASYYGTFDQSGNVAQWNDLSGAGNIKGYRGGSWNYGSAYPLSSGDRVDGQYVGSGDGTARVGIRLAGQYIVAPVPEIDTNGLTHVIALLAGALGFLERRRLRRCHPSMG
ncbi:MAG: SUMF1/EgtB/PvdO family nonheme iron enzyme [Planctomycetia bacterium]